SRLFPSPYVSSINRPSVLSTRILGALDLLVKGIFGALYRTCQHAHAIEAKKEALARDRAERRADDAESYAASSIYFALMALDDAECAAREAVEARAYAASLA